MVDDLASRASRVSRADGCDRIRAAGMASQSKDLRDGPLEIGQAFLGKYQILSRIGRGGHGTVYHAVNTFLGTHVALKVLFRPGGITADMLRRGQAEAQLMSRLRHRNIVEVIDAGITDEGLLYIVMELLRGLSLRELLIQHGRLNVAEALQLGAQIAEGTHAAHLAGAIHRDLKPENVFVLADNRVKILDFGVAKLVDIAAWTTEKNIVLGTMLYMSPEQVQARPLTPRSDIYSLGVALFETLYGVHPVRLLVPDPDADAWAITRAVVTKFPRMLSELDSRIPRSVASLIQRMMAKVPDQRFDSMKSVAGAIRECLGAYLAVVSTKAGSLPSRDLTRFSGRSAKLQHRGPHGTASLPPGEEAGADFHDTKSLSAPLFLGAGFAGVPGTPMRQAALAPSAGRAGRESRAPAPAGQLASTHTRRRELVGAPHVPPHKPSNLRSNAQPDTARPVITPSPAPAPAIPGFRALDLRLTFTAAVFLSTLIGVPLLVSHCPRGPNPVLRAGSRSSPELPDSERAPQNATSATEPAAHPAPPPASSPEMVASAPSDAKADPAAHALTAKMTVQKPVPPSTDPKGLSGTAGNPAPKPRPTSERRSAGGTGSDPFDRPFAPPKEDREARLE